jgi:hypothetical protein
MKIETLGSSNVGLGGRDVSKVVTCEPSAKEIFGGVHGPLQFSEPYLIAVAEKCFEGQAVRPLNTTFNLERYETFA